jgi:CBS domain-containing protein
MRAHQIMTKNVLTVLPETPIREAAHKMLQNHLSGLPVIDSSGKLVGIVSESDFLRRSEISTQERRPRWLQYFFSPAHSANDFIHERGRKVEDVMTRDPIRADENTPLDQLVHLMEKNNIKRVPVLRQDKLVGIVTRARLSRLKISQGSRKFTTICALSTLGLGFTWNLPKT